ncbi:unnamed protein product [Prorocentrum cordatum]|uniref:Uncharacterized protein n=1 Tax=Prorocentrum cordatum TaxID=2364126 RepID=A0ABN9WBT1_9DINO|nr:unnamed protein product [Polarella glacialis]
MFGTIEKIGEERRGEERRGEERREGGAPVGGGARKGVGEGEGGKLLRSRLLLRRARPYIERRGPRLLRSRGASKKPSPLLLPPLCAWPSSPGPCRPIFINNKISVHANVGQLPVQGELLF